MGRRNKARWIIAGLAVVVSLGAAAAGFVFLAAKAGWLGGSPLGGDVFLSYDLGGEVGEQPPNGSLPAIFEAKRPTLRTLVESLDRGASDPKVKGAVLHVSGLPGLGWGRARELRDAVLRFRKSGKPVYAHIEQATNVEYFVASAATKVYAVPTALIGLTGLSAEVMFFRGTLDKLGVEAQFVGVGKYKNAPNQYTETGFTEPHREQMDALVAGLFEEYVSGLAEAREKPRDQIEALLADGPYDAQRALAAGLLDGLLYKDELQSRMGTASKTAPGRYLKGTRGLGFGGARIALVHVSGEIVDGHSGSSPFGGSFAGSDTVAAAIREAREDSSIRAIVLRIDSPGGSGTASDVIWREVSRAKQTKPVVASMGDYAASGGYYVAMGADEIVAEPGTITGSIGVFGGKLSFGGLYSKLGVNMASVSRGESGGMFSDSRPWTEKEKARIHGLLASFYDTFLAKAAEGRKRTTDEIHAVAQGRVWTGRDALSQGLVDRLGGLDSAIRSARERARIGPTEEVSVVVFPAPRTFFETIMQRPDDDAEVRLPTAELRALARYARVMGPAGAPVARLPFELAVR